MSPSPSAHAFGGLDRLELRAGHGLAGLEPVDPAVAGRVQQDAATDDAVRVRGDAAPLRAARGQLRGRPAVVELPPVGDVIERIDVGVAIAVAGHAEETHPERQPACADREVVHQRHEVHGGVGVVGPGHLVDRDGHRHGAPALHQGGGGGNLVRGQVVERAELVVRSPASPVLDRLEHGVELSETDGSGRGQGSRHRTGASTASASCAAVRTEPGARLAPWPGWLVVAEPTLPGAGGGRTHGLDSIRGEDQARLPNGRRHVAIVVTSLFCVGRDRRSVAFGRASLNAGLGSTMRKIAMSRA